MLSHACGPLVLWSSFGPLVVLFIFSSFFVFSKFLNQDYFGFGVWIFSGTFHTGIFCTKKKLCIK